jgi:hypothetical protein
MLQDSDRITDPDRDLTSATDGLTADATAALDDPWPRRRRMPDEDWSRSPAMQQLVRRLCRPSDATPSPVGATPTPTPTAPESPTPAATSLLAHGRRFESGPRVIVVGRRVEREPAD